MGKFDKYKIDLKGMQADSCKYEFVLDNLFFANIDGPEVQKGKVNVTLVVKKTSRAFELNFQTDGMVWVPCDRCLDDMEQPVSSTDKLMVKFGHEYAEEGDNLIVIPEEEGEINVAWFMYEFIALAIPMKHVHAPGKCNKAVSSKLHKHLRTKADEDDAEDEIFIEGEDALPGGDVEETQIDPRWNELKKILDNKKKKKKMAHPKRRQSKTRTAKRRTHDKAVAPTLAICPNCGEWHVYHTVCGACGYYRGKLAIEKEAAV